jgi:hypothetical protein
MEVDMDPKNAEVVIAALVHAIADATDAAHGLDYTTPKQKHSTSVRVRSMRLLIALLTNQVGEEAIVDAEFFDRHSELNGPRIADILRRNRTPIGK